MGWEPTTTYEHDDAGRLVSSRPEVEWDDTERAWMLGLAEYEAGLCPLCGLPSDQCQSADAEALAEAGLPVRCHVATARAQRAEEYKDAKQGSALLFPAGLREPVAAPVPAAS